MTRSQARNKIWQGAVAVDGVVERTIDRKVDPTASEITLDGHPLGFREYLYVMMNKPSGYVSATRDRDEATVLELLPEEYRRRGMAPAGRLDKDTEGLLIITDDGAFAHKLISPNKGVYKTYTARLDKPMERSAIKKFSEGIVLDSGEKCLPAQLCIGDEPCEVTIRICEGKYHQVKRMCAAVGCHVQALRRVAIGALSLDESLEAGQCRLLSTEELEKLLQSEK